MIHEVDYVFLHGQGSQDIPQTDGSIVVEPSIRGKIEVAAVTPETLDAVGIKVRKGWVVSGVVFPGQTESMARIDANAMIKAGIPENKIIVDENARTTAQEVQFASNLAAQNGDHVLHVTYGDLHADEVRMLGRRRYKPGSKFTVLRAEQILTRDPSQLSSETSEDNRQRYGRLKEHADVFIPGYEQTRKEKRIKNYERGKRLVTKLRGEKTLEVVSKFFRPDPSR